MIDRKTAKRWLKNLKKPGRRYEINYVVNGFETPGPALKVDLWISDATAKMLFQMIKDHQGYWELRRPGCDLVDSTI